MLGICFDKVSARREQYKIKSQEIFIFIAEPQPNLAYAKLVQGESNIK